MTSPPGRTGAKSRTHLALGTRPHGSRLSHAASATRGARPGRQQAWKPVLP